MIYTGIIMIRKPFCTWRICSLLAALFFIVPVSLHAQKRDFTTWASTGFKYKVNPAFTLSGKLEWRTKDDLDKTDRWGLEAGGGKPAVAQAGGKNISELQNAIDEGVRIIESQL